MHFTIRLNRSKKQYAKKNYAHAGGQPAKNFRPVTSSWSLIRAATTLTKQKTEKKAKKLRRM